MNASRLSGLACAATLLVGATLASDASAGPILTYVGKPFTETAAGAGNVELTVEFNAPLVASSVLTEADLATWSITSLGRTITSLDGPTFLKAEFTIGASLLPTSWGFFVEKDIEGGANPEQWTTFIDPQSIRSGPGFDAFSIDDSSPNSPLATGNPFSVVRGQPGTWTAIAAVPEPGALGLLGLGLAGLGFARRRKTARAATQA